MPRKINWESQIGWRLKLRDLHVFYTVVQHGSMAKAAAQLGVSQPAVSELMASLEHSLGVRLLDRSSRGVEPTMYGNALLKRSIAVFDELKQGIRDIEFLADPTTGELKIACGSAIAATIIPHVIERFFKKYPRVVLHFDEVASASAARNFPELRDRKYDLILARGRIPAPGRSLPAEEQLADELNFETLFEDPLVIAAGAQSKWVAHHGKIDLAELVDGPWIMQAPQTRNYRQLAEAFHAHGLAMPKASFVTLSMSVIAHFVPDGPFITAMPRSVAHFNSLKVLPVDLPVRPWPVNIVTLKNRTLSPVVERFIECAREVTKSIAGRPERHSAYRRKPNVS
jgi:DNA-binding transcriptional LysR family regulator